MVGGSPSMDYKLWQRMTAALQRLPELVRQMRASKAKE